MHRAKHIQRLLTPAAALLALACLGLPARAGEAVPGAGGGGGAEEFTDDLIILKSDLAIEGRVVRDDARSITILVEYGTLEIPRAAVKRIEYNVASRLAELAADDYAGRYKVLAKAIEEGNISQLQLLEELVGKPGVPPEIYRLLARCYEAQGELRKALEYWKKYALARPRDEEAKERVAELAERLGIKPKASVQAKVAAPAKDAAAGKVAAGNQPAAAETGEEGDEKADEKPAEPEAAEGPAVTEGLEADGKWEALGWGNPATVTVPALDGNKVVMVEVAERGTKDKAAIQRQGRLDLSGNGKLAFRVFNGEKRRADIAVALITSQGYFESRTVRANPDWNMDLSVALKGKTWKSKATNWAFKTDVSGLDSVRQVIFLIYCGRRKALLYFDYIHAE